MDVFKILKIIFLVIIIYLIINLIVVVTKLYPAYNQITKLDFIDVDPNFKIFVGYGSNTGVLKSNKPGGKVLVIDTKFKEGAKYVADYVKKNCWDKKVIIVNTQCHYDHIDGNKLYKAHRVISGPCDPKFFDFEYDDPPEPDEIVDGLKVLWIGNEKVTIINLGTIYAKSNLIVYLHNRNVLFTGDIVYNNWHPYFNTKYPTDIGKWICILNKLKYKSGIKMVVPGHGSISSSKVLINMRDYLQDMNKAADDPNMEEVLIEKYGKYFDIPYFTGIDKTLEYMRGEEVCDEKILLKDPPIP